MAVTGMVTGAHPQLKVMTPPWVTAELSASKVQLAAVPIPTTAGLETSAGSPAAGTPALHEALGLPAFGVLPQPPSTLTGLALDEAPADDARLDEAPLDDALVDDTLVDDAPVELREVAAESSGPAGAPPPHPPATVHTNPTPRPVAAMAAQRLAATAARLRFEVTS